VAARHTAVLTGTAVVVEDKCKVGAAALVGDYKQLLEAKDKVVEVVA